MSIFNAVTPGDGRDCGGLRSLRSLRPLPQSTSSRLPRNSYLAGPSPCPCPGVDTPPQSLPSSRLHSPSSTLALSSFRSHSPDCILSAPFSHYHPPGYFLLLPSSYTFLPPPSSYRYLPPTLSSKHATSHHFALVLFNIHTLFSYMLMQPDTLKSLTHFRDNYAVFKT